MAEIIARFEVNGVMRAVAMDEREFSASSVENYHSLVKLVPPLIRPAIDAFLFAMRHGPIQKLLRDRKLAPMCKDCPDKDGQAIDAFVRLYFASIVEAATDKETGQLLPVDIRSKDLALAYNGLFRRVPELDGPVPNEIADDSPTQIETAGAVPVEQTPA